jgi:hypothetical protein
MENNQVDSIAYRSRDIRSSKKWSLSLISMGGRLKNVKDPMLLSRDIVNMKHHLFPENSLVT